MAKEKILGIFGFGEAGQLLAEGLIGDGYKSKNIKAYDLNYKFLARKADELNIDLYSNPNSFLEKIDFLIVLVPCSAVLNVAKEILPKLKKDCIYIDLSTSFPDDQKKIGTISDQFNIKYCDGAILGSLPKFKHRVPILISGEGTDKIKDYFSQWNMNISIVGNEPGRASAIKLCRSIYSKGTQALLIELIKATEHFQVTDIVLESFEKTWFLEGFTKEANRLIKSTKTHYKRRKDEIDYSVKMLEDAGMPAYMSKCASKVLGLLDSKYKSGK